MVGFPKYIPHLVMRNIMMADCRHWRSIDHLHGGRCALLGKTVSFGVCRRCELASPPGWWRRLLRRWRLGTKAKAITTAAGVKPCAGCQRRANRMDGV